MRAHAIRSSGGDRADQDADRPPAGCVLTHHVLPPGLALPVNYLQHDAFRAQPQGTDAGHRSCCHKRPLAPFLLAGVSIAVMGCIVNGPGEMADADFGYVGGAPGKIDLYVGKEVVKRGIPMDGACDVLVQLIKVICIDYCPYCHAACCTLS